MIGCARESVLGPLVDGGQPHGITMNNPGQWPLFICDFKFPFVGQHDDFYHGQIWRISCGYGCGLHHHTWYPNAATHSIDLIRDDGHASEGSWVLAASRGVVTYSGWKSGYGWCVEMDHDHNHTGSGYKSIVAHLKENPYQYVHPNDDLLQGTILGKCGASGGHWPAHIHFSIWQNDQTTPIDGISGDAHIVTGGRYCSGNSIVLPPRGM